MIAAPPKERPGDAPLLPETPAPVLHAAGSWIGAVFAALLAALVALPDSVPALLAIAGAGVVAVAARLAGHRPAPRNHPALPWLGLLVLLEAAALLTGVHPFPNLLAIPALLAAWSLAILLRHERAVRAAAWGALLAATVAVLAIAARAAWFDGRPAGPRVHTHLLLLVVALGPWMARRRGDRFRLGWVLAGAAVLTALAPSLLTPETPVHLPRPALPDHPAALLLFVPVLAGAALALIKTSLKEASRWSELGDEAPLLRGVVWLVLAAAVFAWITPADAAWRLAWTAGLGIGLAFGARESLIQRDDTRHPPRRPVPVREQLRELWIVLRSNTAWLATRLRRPRIPNDPLPRRLLDPSSPRVVSSYMEGEPRWVPLVMHLHSNVWEGAFTGEEVVDHFHRIGAGSVILTNHNRMEEVDHPAAGPASYEHGWGTHSHHVLVLGAEGTVTDRHPYGSRFGYRAETLARLRGIGEVLVLAHPKNSNAWSRQDVAALDYDLVEVFNKSSDDEERWDQALSAGLLVWGSAGDDGHDLRSRHQTGKRFMLLDLRGEGEVREDGTAAQDAVLRALRQGRFIAMRQANRGVSRSLPHPDAPAIVRFRHHADGVTVHFDREVERAEIIGPEGARVSALRGVREVRLAPRQGETYQRLRIVHGVHQILLNPVARLLPDANTGGILPSPDGTA